MEDHRQVAQGQTTGTDAPRQVRQEYHRTTHHITQAPIDDVEPPYVTRERYQTLEEVQSSRKHMGVATSDPTYLADAPLSRLKPGADQPRAPERVAERGPRAKQTLTHSSRYLQTPKPGRSIFISREVRRKQRTRKAIWVLVALIVIVLIVCFFVLK